MEISGQKSKTKTTIDVHEAIPLSETNFSDLYTQMKRHLGEIIDIGKPEMWKITEKELWENFIKIETKWNEIVDIFLSEYRVHNKTLKWVFFSDYPKTTLSYIYNSCNYKEKLLPNHLKRGVLYFNIIPLTIHYKSIDTNHLKTTHRSLFNLFEGYRYQNWQRIKELVENDTRFGLMHERQEIYISELLAELKSVLRREIHFDFWPSMHDTNSFNKMDEIEILLKDRV